MPTYNYMLMSQKDFFENQVMEEILRERATYFITNNKKRDFWILVQPEFIKNNFLEEKIRKSNFYRQQEKNIKCISTSEVSISEKEQTEFLICLISTNKEFIKWVELRLGFFEILEDGERLPKGSFTSNGLVGKIDSNSTNGSILEHSPNILHLDIWSKKARVGLLNGVN